MRSQSNPTRTYCILRRGPQWVLCGGAEAQPVLCSENRDDLLRIACRLGLERGAEVCIFGEQDGLEARLSFKDGRFGIEGALNGSSLDMLWLHRLANESIAALEARADGGVYG